MSAFHDMVDTLMKIKDKNKTLIIGGDLFDTPFPASFAVEFVQSEIRRLTGEGRCTVLGIDGNHDISGGKWLRVCGITPLTDVPVAICGEPALKVCGIGYQRPGDVLATIEGMADRGVRCDILVMHLALGELNRMGAASDIAASEIMHALKSIGVKLVLMGHIHIRQSIVIDGITFAYCGSTEVCSMNEQKDKSFDVIDQETLEFTHVPIKTRQIEHVVISTEEEFARFESGVKENSQTLYSMFVTPNIEDGVARLRGIAKEKNLLMRIQTLRNDNIIPDQQVDRASVGVTGLDQAIALSFKPDSIEAELIRTIFGAPEALKVTIDNFMKSNGEES